MLPFMQPFFINLQYGRPLKRRIFLTVYFILNIYIITLLRLTLIHEQYTVNDADISKKDVRSLRFTRNDNIKNSTLERLIRTQTNLEFLGIPSFSHSTYIWQI